jgi:hypothetical protein
MKTAVVFLSALVVVACASSKQPSGPNVTVHLAQTTTPNDIYYFAGPVSIQYQLAIMNPTNEPLTLERLDLQTIGTGAYSLRTASTPMNLKVPPNGTSVFNISVWGRSRGGYLRATEPVSIRGTAYFRGASGSFIRIFTENLSQMG